MSIDWFIHGANVLYLISYLVKDIFILRFITVIATLTLVPFYLFQGNDPLWAPIVWAGIFTIVNVFQLFILFKERRPVILSAEDDEIYNKSFTAFTVKQFAKLLKSSKKKDVETQETLVAEGDLIERLIFITKGGAKIEKNGKVILELKEGDLVGEVNYITDSPVSFKVIADENSKILFWDCKDFEKTISSDPNINSSWQSLISGRLAQKLIKLK
jgi:Cyclic nucleotide-binding domain